MESIWILFTAGMIGAFISDIIKDNTLELPKIINGKLTLGCLGGLIIGGIAGYYIDGGIFTAAMGGYIGKQLISSLVPNNINELLKKKQSTIIKNETIEELITRIATKNNIDVDLAIKVARCESGLNTKAVGKNTNGTTDRGLYQWNDYYHPEITDEMAFDPEIACQKFCEAVKAGNLSWWNASKKCWG